VPCILPTQALASGPRMYRDCVLPCAMATERERETESESERARERETEEARERNVGKEDGGRGSPPFPFSHSLSYTLCLFLSLTFARREKEGTGEGAEGRDGETAGRRGRVSRLPVLYACQGVQMCLDGHVGQEGGAGNPFLQGQLQYHISKIKIDLNKACTKP